MHEVVRLLSYEIEFLLNNNILWFQSTKFPYCPNKRCYKFQWFYKSQLSNLLTLIYVCRNICNVRHDLSLSLSIIKTQGQILKICKQLFFSFWQTIFTADAILSLSLSTKNNLHFIYIKLLNTHI